MKKEINHIQYKSFIMQNLDGALSKGEVILLNEHLMNCKDCTEYERDMEKIKAGIGDCIIEAPEYLETRVMAAIKAKKPKAFSFVPALSYGVSFAAILFVAIFVMNKPVGLNPSREIVTSVKTIATIKTHAKSIKIAIVKPMNIKVEEIKETTEEKTKSFQVVETNKKELSGAAPIFVPAMKKGETLVAKANVPETVVQASRVFAADSKETPEPSIPAILERDKATVGNNMINPNRGECAVIRVKVEQASKVRIVIYDNAVKPVVLIFDGDKSPNVYEWKWYGRNDTNAVVVQGVYYAYIQIGKLVIKRPIIITK
ncbi:MAG: hypothetical protein WCJ46_00535 [bacterium]